MQSGKEKQSPGWTISSWTGRKASASLPQACWLPPQRSFKWNLPVCLFGFVCKWFTLHCFPWYVQQDAQQGSMNSKPKRVQDYIRLRLNKAAVNMKIHKLIDQWLVSGWLWSKCKKKKYCVFHSDSLNEALSIWLKVLIIITLFISDVDIDPILSNS